MENIEINKLAINDDEDNNTDVDSGSEDDTNNSNVENTDFNDLTIFRNYNEVFQHVINKKIICPTCNSVCDIHCVWCNDKNCIVHSINSTSFSIFQYVSDKLKAYIKLNINYPSNMQIFLTGKFSTKLNSAGKNNFSKFTTFIEIYEYSMLSNVLKMIEKKLYSYDNIITDKNKIYSFKDYVIDRIQCDYLDNTTFSRNTSREYPIVYIDTNKDYEYINKKKDEASNYKKYHMLIINYKGQQHKFELIRLCIIFEHLSENIQSLIKDSLVTVSIVPSSILISKEDAKFKLKFIFTILINIQEKTINVNRPDYAFTNRLTDDDINDFLDKLKNAISYDQEDK